MKRTRLKRKSVTSISKLKEKLWELCKQIIRGRYGPVCYTCGATGLSGSNWHTSHYISSSVCSVEMRYSLDNLRPGCYRCNIHLSGNWLAFEEHLKREKGDIYPEELKKRNRETIGKQYDSLWYMAKIAEYEEILKTTV